MASFIIMMIYYYIRIVSEHFTKFSINFLFFVHIRLLTNSLNSTELRLKYLIHHVAF